jgi:hypothetical protein
VSAPHTHLLRKVPFFGTGVWGCPPDTHLFPLPAM